MPNVTKPAPNGSQPQSDKVFNWTMGNVFHVSSKVIVGSANGAANFYPGAVKLAGTYTDDKVTHPGRTTTCHTKPVYFKVVGGPPCIDLSTDITFTSATG